MLNYSDLSPEQREKAARCHTPEELLKFAKEEGIELSDEDLEKIAGGDEWSIPDCPDCGSSNTQGYGYNFMCRDCGYLWIR